MQTINTKLAANDIIFQLNRHNVTIRRTSYGLIIIYFASLLNITVQLVMLLAIYLAWVYYHNQKEITRLTEQYLKGDK